MYTLPNILTLFRIASIPIFVLAFYWPSEHAKFVSTAIFAVASITDLLDGYLARKLNQSSPFGAFLDPVADKLMVAVALVLAAVDLNSIWVTLPAVVIIGREIVISALREWMAEMGERGVVAVGQIGKIKTTAQMFCIGGLVWQQSELMLQAAYVLLYLASALTLWSMMIYLASAWRFMAPENTK